MSWTTFKLVFRVRSPLHIGWKKISNLQITYPYVTASALWGAFTRRLNEILCEGGRRSGFPVDEEREKDDKRTPTLLFTYLYPSLSDNEPIWPWEKKNRFSFRFLSSHVGTAVAAATQTAEEGSLHEVEFISPHTLDTGEQVYLVGYAFANDKVNEYWKAALKVLQVGGERTYGWGRIEIDGEVNEVASDNRLFKNSNITFETKDGFEQSPCFKLEKGDYLLAHTRTEGIRAVGPVEPLVGRKWQSKAAGHQVEFIGVCYAPGSIVEQPCTVKIGKYGVWEVRPERQ